MTTDITTSAVADPNLQALAAAVHDGRFPGGRESPNWIPFEDELEAGRDYCLRIAETIQAHLRHERVKANVGSAAMATDEPARSAGYQDVQERRGLGAHPNCTTIATVDAVEKWLADVRSGAWTWTRNGRCKYVVLGIDTRAGVHRIADRDGHAITMDELTRQYRADDV